MQNSIRGRSLAFACVSNSEDVLGNNLLRSPLLLDSQMRLHVERGAPSASRGYNKALDATEEDLVVFLHQDVFLPKGWDDLLRHRVKQVDDIDPDWALIGSFGIGAQDGFGYGPVWSTSLGHIVGRVPERPVVVQGFDELLFVLRRSSGLRFDENLAGFHFYGTDIVQTAASRGLKSYAVSLPCVHNDKFKGELDDDYNKSYHYMRRKWRARLPILTPTIKITWHGLNIVRSRVRFARDRPFRQRISQPIEIDPRIYAARCSWNDVSPIES